MTLAFDPYSILLEAAINQVQAAIGRPLLDEELSSVKQSVEKILTQTKEKYNPDPIIPVDVHFNNEEDEWDLYRKEEKIRQTIRLAMYSCLDLLDSDEQFILRIPRMILKFKEAHAELLKIVDDPLYEKILIELYKQPSIEDSCDYKNGRFVKAYLSSPNTYNVDDISRYSFRKAAECYREYWEDRIMDLTRKSAIRERRKYLIEQIDELLYHTTEYPEITKILQEYKAFNVLEIEQLRQKNAPKD